MEKIIKNNQITVIGNLVFEFSFSHEVMGERFYTTKLSVKRKSGNADILPIVVSDRLVDVSKEWTGRIVRVSGQVRTYNKHEENKTHLILSAFAREFEEIQELPFMDFKNDVFLDGFICKNPIYRETPLGRKVADILLAVNRPYGKSDYIPFIVWGRNAVFVNNLEVGAHIKVHGRLQSREYQKKINEYESETRVAYEVSISRIEVVEETED